MRCVTYAEFLAQNPIPFPSTLLPMPTKPVAPCQERVAKATKSVLNTPAKRAPSEKSKEAKVNHVRQFSKLKGKGQLTASEIAEVLDVSRSTAVSRADRLAASGELIKTKVAARAVVFEWRVGAVGARLVAEPMSETQSRFCWMKGRGKMTFQQIADKMGCAITTAREQMTKLTKKGCVKKTNDGYRTFCIWVDP